MKTYDNIFEKIISLENLFLAWDEFKKEKLRKADVIKFEFNLEQNIFSLHYKLKNKTYKHGIYTSFYINDPKQRHIHKASVKDRIIHHTVFLVLYPIFEKTFIYDSYSCRKNKGTHKGIDRLQNLLRKTSKNNRQNCFALKCDVRKFFQSVNHSILISIIERKIQDKDALWLIKEIINSFSSGIPIGNLTSQLFANIYLNELDQYVKHKLKIPFYLRYTDDFILISTSKVKLEFWLKEINNFLSKKLKLQLHPHKVILCRYHLGIDFLGYVQFPDYRLLRVKTKRRMLKKLKQGISEQSLQSYLGVLSHANHHELSEEIKNLFYLNSKIKKPPRSGI
ncbi:MAG: reverse transcriptase/maturase family protein [Patescibacteria group bacterium]